MFRSKRIPMITCLVSMILTPFMVEGRMADNVRDAFMVFNHKAMAIQASLEKLGFSKEFEHAGLEFLTLSSSVDPKGQVKQIAIAGRQMDGILKGFKKFLAENPGLQARLDWMLDTIVTAKAKKTPGVTYDPAKYCLKVCYTMKGGTVAPGTIAAQLKSVANRKITKQSSPDQRYRDAHATLDQFLMSKQVRISWAPKPPPTGEIEVYLDQVVEITKAFNTFLEKYKSNKDRLGKLNRCIASARIVRGTGVQPPRSVPAGKPGKRMPRPPGMKPGKGAATGPGMNGMSSIMLRGEKLIVTKTGNGAVTYEKFSFAANGVLTFTYCPKPASTAKAADIVKMLKIITR